MMHEFIAFPQVHQIARVTVQAVVSEANAWLAEHPLAVVHGTWITQTSVPESEASSLETVYTITILVTE